MPLLVKKVIRCFAGIRKVGVLDWLWFVVWLQSNEFHPSLDKIKIVNGKQLLDERQYRRRKAHHIDVLLSEITDKKSNS